MLSSVEALRKLPARVFGVLMSLEPAPWWASSCSVKHWALAAVLFVTVAAVGASRFGGLEPRD